MHVSMNYVLNGFGENGTAIPENGYSRVALFSETTTTLGAFIAETKEDGNL